MILNSWRFLTLVITIHMIGTLHDLERNFVGSHQAQIVLLESFSIFVTVLYLN